MYFQQMYFQHSSEIWRDYPELVPGVLFADAAGQAHARRWTNRQSAHSAVGDTTTTVLIVVEAMHDSASDDIETLIAALTEELDDIWSVTHNSAVLSQPSPRFEF